MSLQDNLNLGNTMDVTGSLRKISRELLELKPDQVDLPARLEAASWLIAYIAEALDVELQHAANRGKMLARKELESPPGPNGVKNYSVISGDDI